MKYALTESENMQAVRALALAGDEYFRNAKALEREGLPELARSERERGLELRNAQSKMAAAYRSGGGLLVK